MLQDLKSLSELSRNRQKLSHIDPDQVEVLLRVLNQLWQTQIADAQRLTAFTQVFHLLARWVHNSQLVPSSSAVNQASQLQLDIVVRQALKLLQSQWLAASTAAACILLLGAASKGAPSISMPTA